MKEEEIILDKTKSLSGITFPTKEKIGKDLKPQKPISTLGKKLFNIV